MKQESQTSYNGGSALQPDSQVGNTITVIFNLKHDTTNPKRPKKTK